MDEVLLIQLISGITCPDGRRYQELICSDRDGNDVRIVLPVSDECEQEGCDMCSKKDTCEIMAPVEIELGRKVIIHRPERVDVQSEVKKE